MRESSVWRAPRVITLIAVALIHLGLIAFLVLASALRRNVESSYLPIELLYIPSSPLPRVHADTGRRERLRAEIALSLVSPQLASAPPSTPSSGNGYHGKGVDWLAEAHRAVRAYEIRRDYPEQTELSGRSPANDWWPQQGPHAGDPFKTEGGDWIVWINADCYQVARWQAGEPVIDAAPPQIICPGRSGGSQQ